MSTLLGIALGLPVGLLVLWVLVPLVGYSLCRVMEPSAGHWAFEAGRAPAHSEWVYRAQLGPWILFLGFKR